MDDLISTLSEIRSQYNCFDEAEEPYYRALSEVIKMLSQHTDGDMISRQAAIDEITEYGSGDTIYMSVVELKRRIEHLPSAQPEQSDTSEFWRKRADFYSDMCMNLIEEMGRGVKIKSVKISENGIEFIKEQPPAQPEIIRCKKRKWKQGSECVRFADVRPFPDDFCSRAERREE